MKKKLLSNVKKINKVLTISMCLLGSLVANAQSWDWNDCLDWLKYEGFNTLAVYAHPTNEMQSYTITQTTPDVIVKIDFEGTFVDFSSTYKIVRANVPNTNKPYFKDVKVLSERVLVKSFVAWDAAPKLHSTVYEGAPFYQLYDGVKKFEELSLGRKAAFGLTMEFLNKQD